jgi:hypothetical protein
MAKRKPKPSPTPAPHTRLFEFRISVLGGPMLLSFIKANRKLYRTILIRGDQTLEDLHDAIFEAFDRFDGHMYQFEIGGKRLHDPKARRYVMQFAMEDHFGDTPVAGSVEATTIASLGLKEKQAFLYWFDFGDDWVHQVDVKSISNEIPKGRYPQITERIGASPPQYPDLDEMANDFE